MQEARARKKRGELSLCPEGYCQAKMRYKKWSAYASGYASKYCKQAGQKTQRKDSGRDLRRWFREEWIDVCRSKWRRTRSGRYVLEKAAPCGRTSKQGKYPYCRPRYRKSKKSPKTAEELVRARGYEEIRRRCAKKDRRPQRNIR
ncbi:MAG: hypothetical protein CL902_00425 [Dehalococcoidia bacterium]|nr:hypothetical protein [Dehalococcoidia bacterium]